MITVPVDIRLMPATCCICGVIFGLPGAMHRDLEARRGIAVYWCPNGHRQAYDPEQKDK